MEYGLMSLDWSWIGAQITQSVTSHSERILWNCTGYKELTGIKVVSNKKSGKEAEITPMMNFGESADLIPYT